MIVDGYERAANGSFFDVSLEGKSSELGGKVAAWFLVNLERIPPQPNILAHALLHDYLASDTYSLGNGTHTVLESLKIEPDYILGAVKYTELPRAVLSAPGYHKPVELRAITALEP